MTFIRDRLEVSAVNQMHQNWVQRSENTLKRSKDSWRTPTKTDLNWYE
jgi:hypothetical protein